MVLLLALNVALFLPVFVAFMLLIWFGCRACADDDPGGGASSNGGSNHLPPGPFSGPDVPSRVAFTRPDDLARSA